MTDVARSTRPKTASKVPAGHNPPKIFKESRGALTDDESSVEQSDSESRRSQRKRKAVTFPDSEVEDNTAPKKKTKKPVAKDAEADQGEESDASFYKKDKRIAAAKTVEEREGNIEGAVPAKKAKKAAAEEDDVEEDADLAEKKTTKGKAANKPKGKASDKSPETIDNSDDELDASKPSARRQETDDAEEDESSAKSKSRKVPKFNSEQIADSPILTALTKDPWETVAEIFTKYPEKFETFYRQMESQGMVAPGVDSNDDPTYNPAIYQSRVSNIVGAIIADVAHQYDFKNENGKKAMHVQESIDQDLVKIILWALIELSVDGKLFATGSTLMPFSLKKAAYVNPIICAAYRMIGIDLGEEVMAYASLSDIKKTSLSGINESFKVQHKKFKAQIPSNRDAIDEIDGYDDMASKDKTKARKAKLDKVENELTSEVKGLLAKYNISTGQINKVTRMCAIDIVSEPCYPMFNECIQTLIYVIVKLSIAIAIKNKKFTITRDHLVEALTLLKAQI